MCNTCCFGSQTILPQHVTYSRMNVCFEGSALAGFASNTKQCLTLESTCNATTLKMLCFNIAFIFTHLISNQNSWIPVSGHWDDILLVYNIHIVVCMIRWSITLLFWVSMSSYGIMSFLVRYSC
ncbi:Wolbachia palindromic element domain protein [Wolbachia endosymbiont of Cylisticus convexus]|nr:Wolbachia palindromic element domain protein [Wolbachia endosymbiont of Cylisticus convexus]